MVGLEKAEIKIIAVPFKRLHPYRKLVATDKIPIFVKDIDNLYEQNKFTTLHTLGKQLTRLKS